VPKIHGKKNTNTITTKSHKEVINYRLLKEKKTRPLIENLTDVELMIYITETLAARRIYYEKASIKVNAETISASRLAASITKKK